ncbi:MAG: hypothetical protein ACYCSS_14290 [Sulfuriferula sp.]
MAELLPDKAIGANAGSSVETDIPPGIKASHLSAIIRTSRMHTKGWLSAETNEKGISVMTGRSVAHKHTYPAVGFCIYCGSDKYAEGSDCKLGDEHIVPEGLGGRLILKEASCNACETITSRTEMEWLRSSYYAARVQKGLGKKKKRVPTTLPLKVTINGTVVTKAVPLKKYPAMVVTLLFDTPEILLGLGPVDKVLSGGVAVGILPTFGELMKEHLAQGTVTFEPPRISATSTQLGRMLAKIAHAYAVAELGIKGFNAVLQPIILGIDTRHLAYYIGGSREIPPPIPCHYNLSLSVSPSPTGQKFYEVAIRLLSDIQGMPMYRVVVGTEPVNNSV